MSFKRQVDWKENPRLDTPGGELIRTHVEKSGASPQGWLMTSWLEHIVYHVL